MFWTEKSITFLQFHFNLFLSIQLTRSQFVNMNAPERRALKVPDISSRHLDICVLYKTIDKEIITISNVHVSILRLVYIVGL